jgi:transcription elongation factor Elf1
VVERLSLAKLETFDPEGRKGGKQWRFCCPLCGCKKPVNAGHRSVAVNSETGAYLCHRCGASGLLVEYRGSTVSGRRH